MDLEDALEEGRAYFSDKLEKFGAIPQGVDYNGPDAQALRFEQLIRVIDASTPFDLIDYGCGYGGLLGHLREKRWKFTYYGLDELSKMVEAGKHKYGDTPNVHFTTDESTLPVCDYVIAASVFNIKFQAPVDVWRDHTLGVLSRIHALSKKGFSFDILTSYSDADRMALRPDLYFADPLFYFDYCKRNFSREVALLHDYGLYDFTILVRKPG